MRYESIDVLQNSLARDVFHYTRDSKKAAGRALGTLVEIINFYTLKAWGYEKRTAIERRIPEYANPDLIPIHCDVTMFCGAKLDGFPLS